MKTVIKPIAPLYAAADLTTDLIDEMLYGMTCTVLDETDAFYHIETYYGYTGYVTKDCLIDTPDNAPTHIVISSTLDVMPTPEYRKQPILSLPRGSFLTVDETWEKDKYHKVILADGTEGYCVKYHVKKRLDQDHWKTHEREIRESLVKTAMKYLDAPYRWGGKSPYGVDCSGLCSAVYLQHEIIIWRDSDIRGDLRSITREQLKPGDLIFFPGHVAMYIGDDRFIHSNQRYSGVCINSLDAHHPDYREDLLNSIKGMGSVWSDT